MDKPTSKPSFWQGKKRSEKTKKKMSRSRKRYYKNHPEELEKLKKRLRLMANHPKKIEGVRAFNKRRVKKFDDLLLVALLRIKQKREQECQQPTNQ